MDRKLVLTTEQQTAFNDALYTGIQRKDMDMIKLALQNGAEPDLLLFEGITYKRTLRDMWNERDTAAMRLEWVKTAVNSGADLNAGFKGSGDTPWPAVHWLHSHYDKAIMDYMLGNGVTVDTPDPNGNTLLMRAVQDKKADLVEYYLSKWADPLQPCGKDGAFPLQELERSEKFGKKQKAELVTQMMRHVKKHTAPAPLAPVAIVAPAPPPEPAHDIIAPEQASFAKKEPPKQKPSEKHGFAL